MLINFDEYDIHILNLRQQKSILKSFDTQKHSSSKLEKNPKFSFETTVKHNNLLQHIWKVARRNFINKFLLYRFMRVVCLTLTLEEAGFNNWYSRFPLEYKRITLKVLLRVWFHYVKFWLILTNYYVGKYRYLIFLIDTPNNLRQEKIFLEFDSGL